MVKRIRSGRCDYCRLYNEDLDQHAEECRLKPPAPPPERMVYERAPSFRLIPIYVLVFWLGVVSQAVPQYGPLWWAINAAFAVLLIIAPKSTS